MAVRMTGWRARINLEDPCWVDFAGPIKKLVPGRFPDTVVLNGVLPSGVKNQRGLPIRFTCSDDIPGVPYEEHIYSSGQVSTRNNNWHDLFNALAWTRYPRLKSAMNAMHMAAIEQGVPGERGRLRDALTLFDECGAIVVARKRSDLDQLGRRDWKAVFAPTQERWRERFRVFIIGHAMLEKFLQPYKAMTANCLLVLLSGEEFRLPREELCSVLDEKLSRLLLKGGLFNAPGQLSPLPLAGIPGWWRNVAQDEQFYADQQVFRPPPKNLSQPHIVTLQAAGD